MKTNESPLSIGVIYWIVNLFFWLAVVATFFFVMDTVLFYTGLSNDIGSYGRTLPVNIKISETGQLHHDNQTTILKLKAFTEDIEVVNPPRFITKKLVPGNLLIILIALYLIWIFRKFAKNVKNGETFSIKNISLLKRISYVLVVAWLAKTVYAQFLYFYITDHLKLDHIQIASSSFLYNLNIDLLWQALIIWVLAHIFITGLKLKQEKDLTI
jgi:hypothetical protein